MIKSNVVELLHQIVELLQKIKFTFKSFSDKIINHIFVSQSNHKLLPNHKILTIKIYKTWQQIQEES